MLRSLEFQKCSVFDGCDNMVGAKVVCQECIVRNVCDEQVGILSYLGQLNFGINADFDTVPDIGVLSKGIREGFDELAAHAALAT